MKILSIYNHYGSANPSGETLAYKQELNLLRKKNVSIFKYEKFSDDVVQSFFIWRFIEYLLIPFNLIEYFKIRMLLKRQSFDVIHIYNTWPFISVAAFIACRKQKIIVTAPNYRFGCPTGVPQRAGQVCTLCLDKRTVFNSIKYKCFRNSYVMSFIAAINTKLLQKFAIPMITKIIVLTEFQKRKYIDIGFKENQIVIKPSPRISTDSKYYHYDERTYDILFVGRLSEEKGIEKWLDDNTDKALQAGLNICLVGDGPLSEKLRFKYRESINVSFMGNLEQKDTHQIMRLAKIIIVPSRWFEGLPLVIQEAFEFGTPLAVGNVGPLPSLVSEVDGVVINNSDSSASFSEIVHIINDKIVWNKCSQKSLKHNNKYYDSRKNIEDLLDIYKS